jgi:dihydrofolate reductase
MTAPELTLIVAATRSMGIGFQGTMPWKGLKREMQYFARVTTRVPASSQVTKNFNSSTCLSLFLETRLSLNL